jgi:hypothetical protein
MATVIDSAAALTATRASSARRRVVVFGAALAFLSFLDRAAISQAAPAIARDLHLNSVQMGWFSQLSASPTRCAKFRAAGSVTVSALAGCLRALSFSGRFSPPPRGSPGIIRSC